MLKSELGLTGALSPKTSIENYIDQLLHLALASSTISVISDSLVRVTWDGIQEERANSVT